MNNESKTLRCEIVEDLLPLYHDGVVNVITAEAVEEHLKGCEACKKEYESLSSSFSAKAEKTTKEAFTIMIKKKRLRQVLLTVLACVLSCALLSGVYHFLTEVNVVEIKDAQVKSVYRYNDADGEERFYVNYSSETSQSISVERKEEDGKKVCEAILKGTVLHKEGYGSMENTLLLRAEKDTDELVFAGQTVWTEQANGDDEVPAYVYAYDFCENHTNNDEFGDSDSCSWVWSKNTFIIEHAKYGRLTWNTEGKLIDGSPEAEKEILEMYN